MPLTADEIAAVVHRELLPVRTEIADLKGEVGGLRGGLEGDDGLRVRVHVLATRVGALETAVRQSTPPEPPDRRPPDPPPAALPPKRRDDDSDEGTTLSLLTLRGKGWPGLLGRLLALLASGGTLIGGAYRAGQSSAPTPHPAPAVTVSAPPPPSSGAPEP